MTGSRNNQSPAASPPSLPDSNTLCWCLTCGESYRAWPRQDFCTLHRIPDRKPRYRPVTVAGVTTFEVIP